MIFKVIITFIGLAYIYSVSAVSTFINKGQRPELFELMDNEVAVFRLTLDSHEFSLLKDRADYRGLSTPRQNLTDSFEIIRERARYILEGFKMNYTEWCPDINFAYEIPELNIGQDGFPNINIDEIIDGMDFELENYINFDFVNDSLELHIYQSNPKFNITKINDKINEIASSLYSRNEFQSFSKSFSEQLENENFDTQLESLLHYVSHSNVTLFNGVNINEDALSSFNDNNENDNDFDDYNDDDDDYDDYDDETDYDEEENDYPDSFKTKIGSLTVEIAGKVFDFSKITFSLSGQYSRHLVKPNFNLKIRGGDNLYGRSQFKLRSDLTEPTYLRSKLTSDIHKRLGLPGISANYAVLYINDEYMGLFILTDHYKQSWAKYVYGDEDTTNLHKCHAGGFLTMETYNYCDNEHDNIDPYNDPEWANLLTALDNAQSAADIEDIFDVDHFIYEMAIEYLIGGWDHLQLGHNYYMYKPPNGKWLYLSYDHDHEFGINLDRAFIGYIFDDLPEYVLSHDRNYPYYSFNDFTKKHHIIDILILRDPSRFNEIVKDVVTKVFNPATLFPHIDELKEFIKPLVELEYTPDANGNYPGRINDLPTNPYTLEHWEANSEFTTVDTLQYNAYGIKYWILAKYRYVCEAFNMTCDPLYLDENYKYSVNKDLEFKGYYPDLDSSSDTNSELSPSTTSTNTITSTTTNTVTSTATNNSTEDKNQYHCWSELMGYPCCESGNVKVYDHDEVFGDWGYDFVKKEWCGLTPYDGPDPENCWSEKLGYSCCKGCKVYMVDSDGAWGFESHQWCGIPVYCQH